MSTIEVPTREYLLDLLALAAHQVETLIDDDPEWAGSKFIDTGCNLCTEGSTPAKYNTGPCWLHSAQRILRQCPELQSAPAGQQTPNSLIPETDLVRIAEREVIDAALAWLRALKSDDFDSHHACRASDSLVAAASLLESREGEK